MTRLNRDIFIYETIKLLEDQGYHGTSMKNILSACGAQKGSLYHFFPDGKESLVIEAISVQAQHMAEITQDLFSNHQNASDAIYHLIWDMATRAETNGFRVGAPFAAIAQESAATNPQLRLACRDAYRTLQRVVQSKLESNGIASDEAKQLAVAIMAAIDGGILLARTEQTGQPLRMVARSMRYLIESYAS